MSTQNPNIRAAGLKVTLPRAKILELFHRIAEGNSRHLSAEEVHQAMLNDNLEVGLATVYRVLTQFEQAGMLKRSHFETGKAVYELNEGEHHDHIVCLNCGHVEEFLDPAIEARQEAIAQAHGFSLREHSLSLYGVCTKINCPHQTA